MEALLPEAMVVKILRCVVSMLQPRQSLLAAMQRSSATFAEIVQARGSRLMTFQALPSCAIFSQTYLGLSRLLTRVSACEAAEALSLRFCWCICGAG